MPEVVCRAFPFVTFTVMHDGTMVIRPAADPEPPRPAAYENVVLTAVETARVESMGATATAFDHMSSPTGYEGFAALAKAPNRCTLEAELM